MSIGYRTYRFAKQGVVERFTLADLGMLEKRLRIVPDLDARDVSRATETLHLQCTIFLDVVERRRLGGSTDRYPSAVGFASLLLGGGLVTAGALYSLDKPGWAGAVIAGTAGLGLVGIGWERMHRVGLAHRPSVQDMQEYQGVLRGADRYARATRHLANPQYDYVPEEALSLVQVLRDMRLEAESVLVGARYSSTSLM